MEAFSKIEKMNDLNVCKLLRIDLLSLVYNQLKTATSLWVNTE